MTGALRHRCYPALQRILSVRGPDGYTLPVFLPGPSGSGKTTAARQLAGDLGLPFEMNGAVDADYRFLGYQDAGGTYHSTPFRRAFEHGGIYLFDEIDGSNPQALIALNAALGNGVLAFPDTLVTRHKDCHVLAAANTRGDGASDQYVGRARLDAATLDRFVYLDWPYDTDLEHRLVGNQEWVGLVQQYRAAAGEIEDFRHLVTPRATVSGAALLQAGFSQDEVLQMTLRKSMGDQEWAALRRLRLRKAMG